MKWIASLFRGRGLYWALSLCIVIAAACSFFAVKNIVEQNKPQTDQEVRQYGICPKRR